jgi:autotransporter translocation and assembly factor TamB
MLRLAVGGVMLIVLLLLGVSAYLRTEHFQRLLHEQLLSVLRNSLDAEVSLEEVRGPVLQGLEIRNLSIKKDGQEIISLTSGALSIDVVTQLLSALRTASLNVASITITDPVVRLVQDANTGWNVAHLLKSAEQPAQPAQPLPLSVLLPRIVIENGQVFARLADGKEIHLSGLTLDAAVSLTPSGMQAEVKTFDFAAASSDLPTVQGKGNLIYLEHDGVRDASLRMLDLRTALSHVRLAGTARNLVAPILDMTVTIDKLSADDVAALAPPRILKQDLAGQMRITGPLSALQVVTSLDTQHGRLFSAVSANVTQTPPDIGGSLNLERLVVDQMLQIPGVDVGGEVTGEVKFQGSSLDTLQAEVAAYVGGLAVAGKQVGDINLTTNVMGKQISLITEVKGKAGYVYSQGQVRLDDLLAYDATVMVRSLDAKPMTGLPTTPTTNINVDILVKGRGVKPEEMESEAKIVISSSRVGPTTVSQGEFAGTLKHSQLTLEKGMLLANDTEVNVQGQLGALQKTARGKMTYHVLVKNLTPWLAVVGMKGQGGFELNGSAAGELTALHAEGKLSLDKVNIGDNAVRQGLLTYEVADLGGPQPRGRVTAAVNGIQAGRPLQAVNAEATFSGLQPTEVQADVTVQDEKARTHHLKSQVRYAPEQLEVVVQELTLQLPSGIWRTPQQPRLSLRGQVLTIQDFSLERAGQAIRASGVFDLQGPSQGRLQIERFSLAEVRPFLGEAPELEGRVDVDVQIKGTLADPDVTATVLTGPVTIAGQTYAGIQSLAAYQKALLSLNVLFKQDETHALTVDGRLPIALPQAGQASSPTIGEADIQVRSAGLSLAFLELLSHDLKDVQGAVTMDVSLKGPVEALAVAGPIRLHNGRARVKPLGQTFSDIAVEVQLEPTRVRLSNLSVTGGEGRFSGSGVVALDRYQVTNIDLTFQADHFRVIDTKEYRAELSGGMNCSGSLDAPIVTGAMTVVNAVARPNLAMLKSGPAAQDATITVVHNTEELARPTMEAPANEEEGGPVAAAAKGGVYDKLRLDVGVTIPRDTWVHTSEGSIELMGQLQAKKNPSAELTLSGSIDTVRGWVAVQGRKFTLQKGNITFSGETPIDPSLDIIARYTLSEYLVDVVISGTGTQPSILFKSEPALEQADILSLLVFGRPANALSSQEKVSLQSRALQAVAGSVAADLSRSIAEQLGVDNIEFDVGGNPSQSKVGIGKYVAPGVFVSTSQQLGGNSQGQGQEVSIEYQLNDNWQLKASTTARGNNGVDILWKKKY